MKKLGLFLLPFMLVINAYGQSTEYYMQANSGFFYFSKGLSWTYFLSNPGNEPVIDNIYGSMFAPSYGVSAQIQHITNKSLVLGIQFGTELLRSRVRINRIGSLGVGLTTPAKAHGILSMGAINLYPHIGRRFSLYPRIIDLTIGPEVGYVISSWERGVAEDKISKFTYTTDYRVNVPHTYLNIRSTITEYWGKWGLSISYSYGLQRYYTNSYENRPGNHFSHFFMMGLDYRIK